MYKLVEEFKTQDNTYHEIIVYRYNYSWDNVVKYERIHDRIVKKVYGFSNIEKLTEVY